MNNLTALDKILFAIKRKATSLEIDPGSAIGGNLARALNASDPITKIECIFIIRDCALKLYESHTGHSATTHSAVSLIDLCEAALTYLTLIGADENDALDKRIYLKQIKDILDNESNT